MKLQPKTVADTLKAWNYIFPYRKTDGELALVSAKFFKILEPVFSDKAFRMAADIVEAEEEDFPTIAHMRKLVNVVAGQLERQRELDLTQRALPEETELTDAEIAQNLEKIKIIKDMISGKFSIKEAISMQEKIQHYVAN